MSISAPELWAGTAGALIGAVIGGFIPLLWSLWRRSVERRGEIMAMQVEMFRVDINLRALVAAQILAPLYHLPIALTGQALPKLIGDGVLGGNEVLALVDYVNRVEELNRGLDRAREMQSAGNPLLAGEFQRNVLKANEVMNESLERYQGRTVYEAAMQALLRLDGEGGVMSFIREWLNAFGLILGIIGVVFVWKWGLPQPSFQREVGLVVQPATRLPNRKTAAQVAIEQAEAETHYRLMSRIGLSLILMGFGCQLANDFISHLSKKT